MALIDNLVAAGGPTVLAGFSVTELLTDSSTVNSYCTNQATAADDSSNILATKSKSSPLTNPITQATAALATGITNVMSSNPINASGLFNDQLASNAQAAAGNFVNSAVNNAQRQISSANTQLQQALSPNFSIAKTVSAAWNVAQNTMSLALSANGPQLLLAAMQNVAKQIIALENQREPYVDDIIKMINVLYNQLRLVINGPNLSNAYINNLRQALSILITEEAVLRGVRNTLATKNIFNIQTYKGVETQLTVAMNLMRPPGQPSNVKVFENMTVNILPAPLKNTAVGQTIQSTVTGAASSLDALLNTSELQQAFQAMMAMHLTIAQLGSDLEQYQLLTTEINTLLAVFLNMQVSYDSLQQSGALNMSAVNHMDADLDSLATLILDMNSNLSSTPAGPKATFQNSKLTLKGGQWGITVAGIIAHMQTMPAVAVQNLSNSQSIYNAYNKAKATLITYNNTSLGAATATINQAQEDPTELSLLMIRVIGSSFRALTTFTIDKNLETMFHQVMDRATISKNLSGNIISTLTPVTALTPALTSSVSGLFGNINKLLSQMGFDQAANNFGLGQFESVLTGGVQAASYVSSAISALSSLQNNLQNCPAVKQSDISQLNKVQNQMRNDQVTKQLAAQRVASQNAALRSQQLAAQKTAATSQCKTTQATINKCIPAAQQPIQTSDLFNSVTANSTVATA